MAEVISHFKSHISYPNKDLVYFFNLSVLKIPRLTQLIGRQQRIFFEDVAVRFFKQDSRINRIFGIIRFNFFRYMNRTYYEKKVFCSQGNSEALPLHLAQGIFPSEFFEKKCRQPERFSAKSKTLRRLSQQGQEIEMVELCREHLYNPKRSS